MGEGQKGDQFYLPRGLGDPSYCFQVADYPLTPGGCSSCVSGPPGSLYSTVPYEFAPSTGTSLTHPQLCYQLFSYLGPVT